MFYPGCFAGLVAVMVASIVPLRADEPPAPTTKPADATWQIIAKPAAETANRKGEIKLDLTIKNVSAASQSIEVRQNFWYAHSDNPAITFWTWPKNGGHGPVVMFKTMTLAPGETFSHDWTAQIPADAKLGAAKFRVGIALHRDGSALEWTEPATVEIVGDK